jgi:hypothetical protein
LDFKPYLDKWYVKNGKSDFWGCIRIKYNRLASSFTSDRGSDARAWFTDNDSGGFRCIAQTCHDPTPVGWFLFSGAFTDHVYLEKCILAGLARQYGRTFHIGCLPMNQRACKPGPNDEPHEHPGAGRKDFSFPAYKPITIEAAADEVDTVQAFIRRQFNSHADPWNRMKHHDIYLLPPDGAYGSTGSDVRRTKILAHVNIVFSLSTYETKIINPSALDAPVVVDGKTHSLRGVILSVTWPISEALDLPDDIKHTRSRAVDERGENIKRLYHSVDYRRSGEPDHNVHVLTCSNDRHELAEAFIRVLPLYVARRLSPEIAAQWFTPMAILAADEIVLCLDDEGNWTGEWQTAMDLEDLAMLDFQGVAVDLSAAAHTLNDPNRPMLGATDDVSVRTFGTVFGRDAAPVAGDATTQSVASDAPAESLGAAGQAGGSQPD